MTRQFWFIRKLDEVSELKLLSQLRKTLMLVKFFVSMLLNAVSYIISENYVSWVTKSSR